MEVAKQTFLDSVTKLELQSWVGIEKRQNILTIGVGVYKSNIESGLGVRVKKDREVQDQIALIRQAPDSQSYWETQVK